MVVFRRMSGFSEMRGSWGVTMARFLLALLALLFGGTSWANPPPGTGTWVKVFEDNFDGTGDPDAAKWTANWLGCPTCITPPVQSGELAAYDPAQCVVGSGVLRLRTIADPVTIGGTTYPYRSCMIQSNGKFNFTFGYMEANLKVLSSPNGKIANWPAWWSNGQDWPTTGEIDIFEGLSGDACWHFHYSGGAPGGCQPGTGYVDGYHTFGALWEAGMIRYYYDGALIGTVSSGVTSAPMYIIMNHAAGGCCGGELVVPKNMFVNWIRVWQRQ